MLTETISINFSFDSTIQTTSDNRVPSRAELKAMLRKKATQEIKQRMLALHGESGFDYKEGDFLIHFPRIANADKLQRMRECL